MEVVPGLRVVRGPDWKWAEQDGGEGCVGTLVEVTMSDQPTVGNVTPRTVVVHWDSGNRCNYRCGIDGKYDLRVFDSAPVGVKHSGVQCNSCGQKEVTGIRWKCVNCPDYELCTPCYMAAKHNLEHEFDRKEKDNGLSVRVQSRSNATRIAAKGIFPNAEVVRGRDWLWGDQDGGLGKVGRVLEIKGWESETHRSIAEVEWKESHKKNVYRIGHKGKVDLQYKEPGSGGFYYVLHLPVLGAAPPPTPPTAPSTAAKHFSSGDTVRILLDIDVFKLMQEGHGGWKDEMLEATSSIGTVESVSDNGDLRVRFSNKKTWSINPDCVTKVNEFTLGDVVRVIDDIAAVHNYQEDHGGWNDDMALSLGQVGKVLKVYSSGDLRVAVNKRTWTFNPMCLVPAPDASPPDIPASEVAESDDMGLHLKLLSLLENPAVIVAAAAAGSVSSLREFLLKHPGDVNTMAAGKAALHCAAVGGNIEVIKTLLEFQPNLEIEDEDGDKPLHLAAYSDESDAAKLLIEAGADVNARNNKGATPIIIAAVKGNQSVLRLLANNSTIKLNEQDWDGDTPLHCAVLAQKYESVAILLEAGADPTLLNYRLFTPIHEAARIGFLPAMERFIQKFTEHVNIKKDDGFSPLHLSALNDHLDVLTALLESEHCKMDMRTNDAQTALHLAVHQGHSRIVERLVGFGIDINAIDRNGDTALHTALIRDAVDALSADTPQLKKVLETSGQTSISTAVACFLVQEGADLYVKNILGQNPTQLCSDDITTLLLTFAGKKGSFRGSLRYSGVQPPLTPLIGLGTTPTGPAAEELPPPIMTPPIMTPPSSVPPVSAPAVGAAAVGAPAVGAAAVGAPAVGVAAATAEGIQCLLCDELVDVRFEPCGHAVVCTKCAERAKKCPSCKTPVRSFSKLQRKCTMCTEELTSVTMQPCGHKFCQKCALRMRVCFECRKEIQAKDGLVHVVEPVQQPAQPTMPLDASPCMICLTEPRNTALLCGHQLCWDCAQRVDSCPVCRKFITHRIRLFL